MRKVWKRILTFVLAVGMLITTNGFSGLTVAYASTADGVYLQYTDSDGNLQKIYDSGNIFIDQGETIELSFASDSEKSVECVGIGGGYDEEIINLVKTDDGKAVLTGLTFGTASGVRVFYTGLYIVEINVMVQKDIASSDITMKPNDGASYAYTGEEIIPVSLTHANGEVISAETDYTIDRTRGGGSAWRDDFTNAGTGRILITTIGNGKKGENGASYYYGGRETTYTIEACNFNSGNTLSFYNGTEYTDIQYKLEVSGTDNLKFDGKAKEPEVKVFAYSGNEKLYEIEQEANDGSNNYTVEYEDNILPGTDAIVRVSGTGKNCTGTIEEKFTIQGDLSLATIEVLNPDNIIYTNKDGGVKPDGLNVTYTATGADGGAISVPLTEGMDYTASYSNTGAGKNTGTATITAAAGQEVYVGTGTKTFDIQQLNFNDIPKDELEVVVGTQRVRGRPLTISDIDRSTIHITHNGEELVINEDFELVDTDSLTGGWGEDDQAKLIMKGIGNYTGEFEETYSLGIALSDAIDQSDISIMNQVYNGKAQEPTLDSISLKAGGKLTLANGDYSLSYTNNVNAGTATMTITGRKKYAGTVSIPFTISAKDIANQSDSEMEVLVRDKDDPSATNIYKEGDKSTWFETKFTGQRISESSVVKEVSYTPAGGDKTTLIAGSDYTLATQNPTTYFQSAGDKIIEIRGTGNYRGTRLVKYTVSQLQLTEETLKVEYNGSVEYNGRRRSINPTVYYVNPETGEEKRLDTTGTLADSVEIIPPGESTDKDPEKNPNINAFPLNSDDPGADLIGKLVEATEAGPEPNVPYIEITAPATSNFAGSFYYYFAIDPYDFEDAAHDGNIKLEHSSIPDQPYTGKPITVEASLQVELGTAFNSDLRTLTPGVDYEMIDESGLGLVNPGLQTVRIKGIGNYKGTLNRLYNFRIKCNMAPAAGEGKLTMRVGGQDITIENGTLVVGGQDPDATNAVVDPAAHTASATIATQFFNGSAIEPRISMIRYTDNNDSPPPGLSGDLVKDTHYTVEYRNNTQKGTGSMIIQATGDYYMGTITLNFKIEENSFDKADIWFTDNNGVVFADQNITREYTGADITPPFEVFITYETDPQLVTKNYYDISWSNNRNAGTASVTATAKDGYTGGTVRSLTKEFTITPVDIADASKVTIPDNTLMAYTGEPATVGGSNPTLQPEIVFKSPSGNQTLEYGIDYTIELTQNDNGDIGEHTMSIVAVPGGNFTGRKDNVKYTIQYDLSKATIVWYKAGQVEATTQPSYLYVPGANGVRPIALGTAEDIAQSNGTGFQVTMGDRVLIPGVHYLVDDAGYKNNTVLSKDNTVASVRIVPATGPDAKDVVGEKDITFRIVENDLSVMLDEDSGYNIDKNSLTVVYNGKPQTPEPIITYNGERLVKDEHYTLRYVGDRTNAYSNTAEIIVESISGAGFKGTAQIPFTIEPKPLVNDEGELNLIEVVGMEFFRAVLVLEDTNPTTVIEMDDPNNPGQKIYCINNNVNVTVNPFISDQIYTQQSIFELNDQEKSGSNMVLGTDYRIEYVCLNGLQAGRNTYRFVGLGNYTGTYDLVYNVKYKFAESEDGGKITMVENPPQIFGTTQSYNGQEITTSVDVRYDGGTPLREGVDYEIIYSPDNPPIDPGEITATISATENSAYYGSITRTFNIQGSLEEPNRVEVKNITDQFYTGEPLEPDVEVYWNKTRGGGQTRLVKDKDYTVRYERNVEVSDPTRPSTLPIAIIEGIGNYTGRITKTFNIVKIKPINDSNITIGGLESSYYFTGRAQTISGLSVMFTDESGNQYALRQGTEYKVEYLNNTEVGTASIVITGVDRYEGSVTKTFRIIGNFGSKLSGCGVAVDPIPDQRYTGNPVTPRNINVFWNTASKQSVPLTAGRDYEIVSIENNIEVGTAEITINALGENYTGSFVATFKITTDAPENPEDPNQSYTISTGTVSFAGLDEGFPYTGQAITPLPGHQLVYRYDYDMNGQTFSKYVTLDPGQYSVGAYRNNIEPGQASVEINANVNTTDNISGTATVTFNIVGDISGGFANVANIPDQEFTAKEVRPAVQVNWVGAARAAKTLTEGVDYDITYIDNVNIGTATAVIEGKGDYTGTRTVNFRIVMGKIDPTKIIIRESDITLEPTEYGFDGTEKRPEVTVVVDGTTLTEGIDYTLSYKDNINAGTAYAVITGAGEYTNELEKPFTIAPATINDSDVTLLPTAYTYDGKAKTPAATVRVNGKDLVNGTDYIVDYQNNINAGTATAVITGRGNYTGTVNKAFTILSNGGSTSSTGDAANVANATVTGIASCYTYTGSQIKPTVVVRDANGKVLTLNKDYTIQYLNNINAGTGWMIISGKGNYSGFKTPYFTIVKKNINNCTVSIPGSAIYTGSEIRPTLTAKNGSKKMVPGSEYSVTYSNNKKLGRAAVTVRGEGNFTGVKTMYFNIIVKGTTNLKLSSSKTSSVTLKWTKVAKASGYEVYTSNLKKKVATVTSNKNTVTIKKLKTGTSYKYRVRAYIKQGGKKYYGAFSNTVTAMTAPKTVTTTLSSTKVNTVVVKWNKVSGSGYQVYRSVRKNSGYTRIATVTSSSKRSYTDTKAASGGIYYYKVRAYRKSGGKYIYGAFSAPKQITAR